MTIQTDNKRITYIVIDEVARINNLPATYLAFMIDNLEPDIKKQLELKNLNGQLYLGNTAQRYLVSHADRSAASLFPETTVTVNNVVADIQESPSPRPLLEFTVRRDISNDYWLLVREDNAGTTIIGTYADQDKAADARITQLLRKR
jgi:hypothetical protein